MLNAPMFITLITFAQLQHPRFNNPIFPTLKDEQVIPEHGLQQLNKPQFQQEHQLQSQKHGKMLNGNTLQIKGICPLNSISYSLVAEDF